MARQQPEHRPEWPEMVFGSKSVRGLLPLLEHLPPLSDIQPRLADPRRLRRPPAGFLQPDLRSLRTPEDFSRTRQARRYLAVDRLPKSTLADFHRLVDPAVLDPILAHVLRETARRGVTAPADLPESIGQVLAVDGTFLALAADVAWAVRHGTSTGKPKASVRIDVHLDVASGLPRSSTSMAPAPASRPRPRPRSSRGPSTSMTVAISTSP